MPAGSSDNQLSRSAEQQYAAEGRYGRTGFAAAFINVLLLEFLTAVLILSWYMLLFILLPVLIVYALLACGLTRGRRAVAQVGRGMLMGCISAPLTIPYRDSRLVRRPCIRAHLTRQRTNVSDDSPSAQFGAGVRSSADTPEHPRIEGRCYPSCYPVVHAHWASRAIGSCL
jgi:hypothetical protein